MTKKRRNKLQIWICALICLVVVGCAAAVIAMTKTKNNRSETTQTKNESGTHVTINVKQVRLKNAQQLAEQTALLLSQAVPVKTIYNKNQVIDWQKNDVVSILFSRFSARSFISAVVSEDSTHPTIVITFKEPPQGCMTTQDNVVEAVYVAVPKDDHVYAVTQHTEQNQETCKKS